MKIKFYATGGTIDKVYFDAKSEYQVGAPQVEEILKDSNVAFEYEVESILQKDSLEMTDQDRQKIREIIENEQCDKIVITHGTDTMVETAKFCWEFPKQSSSPVRWSQPVPDTRMQPSTSELQLAQFKLCAKEFILQ